MPTCTVPGCGLSTRAPLVSLHDGRHSHIRASPQGFTSECHIRASHQSVTSELHPARLLCHFSTIYTQLCGFRLAKTLDSVLHIRGSPHTLDRPLFLAVSPSLRSRYPTERPTEVQLPTVQLYMVRHDNYVDMCILYINSTAHTKSTIRQYA